MHDSFYSQVRPQSFKIKRNYSKLYIYIIRQLSLYNIKKLRNVTRSETSF